MEIVADVLIADPSNIEALVIKGNTRFFIKDGARSNFSCRDCWAPIARTVPGGAQRFGHIGDGNNYQERDYSTSQLHV